MAPKLPAEILVHRLPDGTFDVLVDGVPIPWLLNADDPVTVDIQHGAVGGVRLTLMAASVRVLDERLLHAADQLEHTHAPDEADTGDVVDLPAEPPAAAAPTKHGVVADRQGNTWPRCSRECSIKAIGVGLAVCDSDQDACTPPAPIAVKLI